MKITVFHMSRPKWLRTDSWQFHAIIIFVVITITIYILNLLAERDIISAQTQNAANVALNWTALAYAIYIYYLYDSARQSAVRKLEEGGVKVVSLEEGISTIIKEFQPLTKWFSENREGIIKIGEKLKEVDINKLVALFDEMEKMVDTLKQTGYSKENLEKMVDTVVKLSHLMDRLNGQNPERIEEWFVSLVNIAGKFERVDPKKLEKWFDLLFETLDREDAIERAKTLTEAPADEFLLSKKGGQDG